MDNQQKQPAQTNDKSLAEAIKEADERREKEVQNAIQDYRKIIQENYGQRKEIHITPWLLIRHSPTDMGLRPIPPGNPFWISPDIWVESSHPLGNPVEGEPNFVHARIFNLGEFNAAPVKVDFYWADPSLGFGPANMNFIGTEWLEVKSLNQVDVRCQTPWVPTFINNGHECLIANCSNHILDPIIYPFEPVLDRHVGQRNVHVEKALAGQAFQLKVNLNNIFPFVAINRVIARMERMYFEAANENFPLQQLINEVVSFGAPVLNTPAEMKNRFNPGTKPFPTAQEVSKLANRNKNRNNRLIYLQESDWAQVQPKIISEISERAAFVHHLHSEKILGNLLLAKVDFSDFSCVKQSKKAITLHHLDMKPNEQRTLNVEITIPTDARAGEFIVLHLAQESYDFTLGGYAFVFHIH